jgi:hypothetical protein
VDPCGSWGSCGSCGDVLRCLMSFFWANGLCGSLFLPRISPTCFEWRKLHQRVDPGLASCLGGPSFRCPWFRKTPVSSTMYCSLIIINQQCPLMTCMIAGINCQVVLAHFYQKFATRREWVTRSCEFHSFLHVLASFQLGVRSKWVAGQDARKSLDCTIRYRYL